MPQARLDDQRRLNTAPERSVQQRMDALVHANEIRVFRAELKREIKHGHADALAFLADPPDKVDTMKVFDLLIAMPKVGRVKANKALQRAHVSPSKTIGGLTDRQRADLLAVLGRHDLYRQIRRRARGESAGDYLTVGGMNVRAA